METYNSLLFFKICDNVYFYDNNFQNLYFDDGFGESIGSYTHIGGIQFRYDRWLLNIQVQVSLNKGRMHTFMFFLTYFALIDALFYKHVKCLLE